MLQGYNSEPKRPLFSGSSQTTGGDTPDSQSDPPCLCGLGQVTYPGGASVSLSIKKGLIIGPTL